MTTLATEPSGVEPEPGTPALEKRAETERMRHIPPLAWIIAKIEGDVRRRIGILLNALDGRTENDPRSHAADEALRRVCRALERLLECTRQGRNHGQQGGHAPPGRGERVRWLVEQILRSLSTYDGEAFGRRAPFHLFEKSRSEALYGAFLSVLDAIERLGSKVREIDPGVDERLYEGLVKLETPLSQDPIA